ncbi:MAG: hypothetical protein ABSE42_03420 [Bryobacteraceae bacterium]|jgi:tetratricopeptide (TPR) repeat protein
MPAGLSLVVELVNLGLDVYRKRQQEHVSKIDRLLDEARTASGKERSTLLASLCEECARLIKKKPGNAHALHNWGVALWWRAALATSGEAERLYAQADKKFSQAQALAPSKGSIRADRAEALRYRSALHSGEEGRRLLVQVCEECEKRVGIYASGPDDARMFHTWGMVLWWLAARERGDEAKRLYKEADDKFTRGRTLAPDQTDAAVDRAEALVWRSALYSGEEKREMLQRVCEQCEELAGRGTGGARMLTIWGSALCWLGTMATGAEAERFYAEAEKKTSRALRIDPDTANAADLRARAMEGRALLESGETRRNLLTQVCEECEQLAGANPQDAKVIESWARALAWLATIESGDEADRRFAAAEEKCRLGLGLAPGEPQFAYGLVRAMVDRADLHAGEDGRALLTRACDECERMAARNPEDADLLGVWACALCWLGRRAPDGSEADHLYAGAEEKCTLALTISPVDEQLLNHMGRALFLRAHLRKGDDGDSFLARATSLFEEAVRANPDCYTRLAFWPEVLYLRAKRMPGEDTSRLLSDAVDRYERAAQNGAHPDSILKSWATLLCAQARCAEGDRSAELLREAKKKLIEAVSRLPRFGAYELACVCARLGEPAECRSWLEKSGEPGIRVRPDEMAAQAEFESVRECDWFRQLLSR